MRNALRSLGPLAFAALLGACAHNGGTPGAKSADPGTGAPIATRAGTESGSTRPGAALLADATERAATSRTAGDTAMQDEAELQVIEIKEIKRLPTVDLTAPPDDLWQRIRQGFAIPNLDGPLVVERQLSYASRPAQMRLMFERSRLYLYHIVDEIERRNMPTELALLPMVESAFNPKAYSPARAAGLWQFIPSTGKSYKLQQNWWYDARRDIVASTNAALDYLQKLYEMHGDWHLALASYNWGENAVGRAIEKNRAAGLPADYSSLSMPDETRYYVPKLQAIKNLVMSPAAFGIDLDPIANQPYFVTVTLTRDIDLGVAAKLAEMPLDELVRLNPGHNRPVIETSVAPTLVLPTDRAGRFAHNLAQHDKPLSTWTTYSTRKGDRLPRIAAAYGMSAEQLASVNGLAAKSKLAPGQTLLVPLRAPRSDAESFVAVPASAPGARAPHASPKSAKGGKASATARSTKGGPQGARSTPSTRGNTPAAKAAPAASSKAPPASAQKSSASAARSPAKSGARSGLTPQSRARQGAPVQVARRP